MRDPVHKPHSLLREFLGGEASGGIVLMAAAALALIVANSPLLGAYEGALHAKLGPLSLEHWINDALMALFFLLVGLEIKREMIDGQLATWPRRVLPGIAAAGGMLVPALIYVALNVQDPEAIRGWAIPTATDIAFALGVISLLGSRVPASLKIFLAALAIIDDLGAVIIIALFYSSGISVPDLVGASGLIVKREWLKFYTPEEKPKSFELIVQSWDTANKNTELANYSACTTWGLKDRHLYLLDVFRRKMEFPELKRLVRELARLHDANIVLIEDKASGSSLIQELRAEHFSMVQAAPAMDGDKIMRLRSQTAKIDGGFALFPKRAPWLDVYLSELIGFPNAKNDDQVDSTVFALAWMTDNTHWSGWTDESVAALGRVVDKMWHAQRWQRHFGF